MTDTELIAALRGKMTDTELVAALRGDHCAGGSLRHRAADRLAGAVRDAEQLAASLPDCPRCGGRRWVNDEPCDSCLDGKVTIKQLVEWWNDSDRSVSVSPTVADQLAKREGL